MISTPFNKRLHTTRRAGAPAPPAGPIHLCSPSCLSATCARSRLPLVPWCNYHVWLTRADEEREGHNARTFVGLSRKKNKKKESEKEENEENHRSLCCNLATQQHGHLPDKHTQTHTDRETRRKAECGDDEAASLPGSILRWINTPRGDAALLHCCGQRT